MIAHFEDVVGTEARARIFGSLLWSKASKLRMATYGEGQVFAAELLGTATMCAVGLGGVANAVLPGTKGHGIGFLGIAFCFGLGVFLPLQFVGHVSGTTRSPTWWLLLAN